MQASQRLDMCLCVPLPTIHTDPPTEPELVAGLSQTLLLQISARSMHLPSRPAVKWSSQPSSYAVWQQAILNLPVHTSFQGCDSIYSISYLNLVESGVEVRLVFKVTLAWPLLAGYEKCCRCLSQVQREHFSGWLHAQIFGLFSALHTCWAWIVEAPHWNLNQGNLMGQIILR